MFLRKKDDEGELHCSSPSDEAKYLYPFLRGRMYRYLETNLGVMSLSKDEMERVRQA